MSRSLPTPQAYFDRMYQGAEDPWQLDSRWYEQRKYTLTVGSLPRERYRSAFEPACSVGVLTAALAERCDAVQAIDIAPSAVAIARERCANRAPSRISQS